MNILLIALFTWSMGAPAPQASTTMYPELKTYLDNAAARFETIPQERKDELAFLASWIQERKDSAQAIQLTFICTHNSRRSHLGMIWAAAAAEYYGIQNVETFSGGTEATAFNPRAVAAVQRAGITVENPDPNNTNPHYALRLAQDGRTLTCFSKKYDDAVNPHSGFCAVMVCSSADRNCPFVPGAAMRLAIPYEDPKQSDGTAAESATYDARSLQIATEMLYVFSLVK
jgi:hypothetical protein